MGRKTENKSGAEGDTRAFRLLLTASTASHRKPTPAYRGQTIQRQGMFKGFRCGFKIRSELGLVQGSGVRGLDKMVRVRLRKLDVMVKVRVRGLDCMVTVPMRACSSTHELSTIQW